MELSKLKKISEEVTMKLGLIPKINNLGKIEELKMQLVVINDFLVLDKYLSDEAMKIIRGLKQ